MTEPTRLTTFSRADGELINDEYMMMADDAWAADDEPVVVLKQVWQLVSADKYVRGADCWIKLFCSYCGEELRAFTVEEVETGECNHIYGLCKDCEAAEREP